MGDVVFCKSCGAFLGKYRPNFAKEHLRQYPSHMDYLVKTLIDPLTLPEAQLRMRLSRQITNQFGTTYHDQPETGQSQNFGWNSYKSLSAGEVDC
jgi:hypothetical protein